MKTKNIYQKDAITFGWKTAIDNFFFFFGLLMIIFLVSAGTSALESVSKNDFAYFIIFSLSIFVTIMIQAGAIKITLDFVDGKKPSYRELVAYTDLIGRIFISSLLVGLTVIGGLILLIVPGIIWGIKFKYFMYFIIEKNAGPVEAMKMSAELTNGAKGQLFVLELLLCLINFLGILCLFIGVFFTIPLTLVVRSYVYRKLEAQTKGLGHHKKTTAPAAA
jgi:uncharacterized membrane protein